MLPELTINYKVYLDVLNWKKMSCFSFIYIRAIKIEKGIKFKVEKEKAMQYVFTLVDTNTFNYFLAQTVT